uniref:Uncharacterized protein n=1 Tax=Oryza punctata TaxID=4537 RepID=A0A0E0LGI6_ORYPU
MDRCKHRVMEDDEMEQEVRRCSLPKLIAYATRSFFSFFSDKNVDSVITTLTIQRFESIGQINYMLVDPLVGHLLSGKALQYENFDGRGSTVTMI